MTHCGQGNGYVITLVLFILLVIVLGAAVAC